MRPKKTDVTFATFKPNVKSSWYITEKITHDQNRTDMLEKRIVNVVGAAFEPYFKGSWNITCTKTQHQCKAKTGEQNISNVDIGSFKSLVAKVDVFFEETISKGGYFWSTKIIADFL